ncbi:MAG: tRNA (adenosine(37)-N6)-threonylcarbamoyltransferase complex transferase subunit TsaD [bacterium]|nr:tRNA (adenosine(37)-N6)-threonylcarbamoyltransferase complex transferase subunit TsaD [bacterium]
MTEPTYILGIESSCDETACGIVANGMDVLSNCVASQIELHKRFGGVVPELASRAHIEAINNIITTAIRDADIEPGKISAVAIANEPGLIGSLLIGLMAAKTIAWIWNVPLVAVNHVYAHAYAATLDTGPIDYPAVALICSGGHTALYQCDSPMEMTLLGSTIDDAAGEAFDKVSKILQLGYPGGPVIDRVSRDGNPKLIDFPRSLLSRDSLDFSFSGLKTAVLYHINGVPGPQATRTGRKPGPTAKRAAMQENAGRGIENFTEQEIADVAAGFQAAVVDTLRIKLRRAVEKIGAKTMVIGGGVAANSALRTAVMELGDKLGCSVRMPAMEYCVDNAAMTAGLGYHYLMSGKVADLGLSALATVRR